MILAIDDRTPAYFLAMLQRITEHAAKRQFLNVLVLAHELEGAGIVCFGAILKGRRAGLEVELESGNPPHPGRIIAQDTAIKEARQAGDQGGDGDGQGGKGKT